MPIRSLLDTRTERVSGITPNDTDINFLLSDTHQSHPLTCQKSNNYPS